MTPTSNRPVMFRAGGTPGAVIAPLAESAGPAVLLADISEFQPQVSDTAYLAWSKAIVIRAMYGDQHDDTAWYGGARRDGLHKGGARFLGIYQYLVAGQSGAAQAQAFRDLVGAMRPGEVFIADYEEGQRSMLADWFNKMVALYGTAIRPYLWTYTGLNFGQSQGVLPVQWLAAYGQAEPSTPHKLWQFTDAYQVPGVGTADCSIFHGSIDELAALAYHPAQKPPPPHPQEEEMAHVLDSLARNTAVVLPVPSGKTKAVVYADHGFSGGVQPEIRVGTAPGWNGGGVVKPVWGKPATVALPHGTTEVTIGRQDTGDVAVTVDFA